MKSVYAFIFIALFSVNSTVFAEEVIQERVQFFANLENALPGLSLQCRTTLITIRKNIDTSLPENKFESMASAKTFGTCTLVDEFDLGVPPGTPTDPDSDEPAVIVPIECNENGTNHGPVDCK